MIAKILAAVAAIPRILDWLEKTWSSIVLAWEARREAARREEMARAIERAKLDKDTCEMERLLDPAKQCVSKRPSAD